MSNIEKTSPLIRSAIFELLNCAPLPHTVDILERTLEITDVLSDDFASLMEDLLSSPFWQLADYSGNPYKVMCLGLAKEIDRLARQSKEPAYHSRQHFKDVCLVISYFISQDRYSLFQQSSSNWWAISLEEKWLLLLAAIAHDLCHSGQVNRTPFEIEKNSLDVLGKYLSQKNINPDLMNLVMSRVGPWILGTDPAIYGQLLTRVSGEQVNHEDCLSMLLVESDLFASALPIKGRVLGARLAKEWRRGYIAGANRIDSVEGRLAFLHHIRFISPYAIAVGAEEIRLSSIKTLTDLKFRD